jgi:hypothetical protein
MNTDSHDDLIYAITEVKTEVSDLEGTAQEVVNATRRLDDAICGVGGVIPHLNAIHGTLTKILWIQTAFLAVLTLNFLLR